MRRFVMLPLVAMLAASCSRPAAPAPSGLAYAVRESTRTFGDCGPDTLTCARITLHWPEITAAATPVAAESLNAFVRGWLLRPYSEGPPAASAAQVMDQFLDAYRSFLQEFPEGSPPWEFERWVDVMGDTLGVVSLAARETGFTGGAHGNADIQYRNIDARTGRGLRVADLLAPGARAALDSLAEREFRKVRELSPDQSLTEAGFWFEGGRFALNENCAVTAAGLRFFFNDYEITSHAEGPTEVTLRWADLGGLVRLPPRAP